MVLVVWRLYKKRSRYAKPLVIFSASATSITHRGFWSSSSTTQFDLDLHSDPRSSRQDGREVSICELSSTTIQMRQC